MRKKKGLARPRKRAKKGVGIGTHDQVRPVRRRADGRPQFRCIACRAVGMKGELRAIPCPRPKKLRPCDVRDLDEAC